MKLYINLGRFFIDNFGLTSSFGLSLCMRRDMVILHKWIQVGCPEKSIGKSSSEVKVILLVVKVMDL